MLGGPGPKPKKITVVSEKKARARSRPAGAGQADGNLGCEGHPEDELWCRESKSVPLAVAMAPALGISVFQMVGF